MIFLFDFNSSIIIIILVEFVKLIVRLRKQCFSSTSQVVIGSRSLEAGLEWNGRKHQPVY